MISLVTQYALEWYLAALIGGVALMIEIGRRLALRRASSTSSSTSTGVSTIVTCCFGLMSLLLAFTFYGAAARFDVRRDLIVQETNAIGTVYRRLDVLPQNVQPRVKELLREYVHTRLESYQKITDPEGFQAVLERTAVLENEIWKEAVEGSSAAGTTSAYFLLLPSVNQMFDLAATRTAALEAHPPLTVTVLLVVTVMVSSLLAGHELAVGGRQNWLYRASYILVLGAALIVITDYEYPRLGFARIAVYDKFIAHALDHLK